MLPDLPKQPQFQEQKFKELILYIAEQCEFDPNFGSTKLNKLLYYCDMLAYGMYGEPITGADYMALERGPAPRLLLPIRRAMEEDDDIVIRQKMHFGLSQDRVVPLREPDLSMFSGKEIALVDQVIRGLKDATGALLSEVTHAEYGWRIAELKESIPYQSVFLSPEPATRDDMDRAKELAIERQWN